MPSNAEIAAYAKKLPEIYRDIMAAFPKVEPRRKAGYGLAFQTLAMHFANTQMEYGLGDVREACIKLADSGFIEIRHEIFAHPTDLGEQLIAVVADTPLASSSGVPSLPARTW